MKKIHQILISTFYSCIAILCNYEFAIGNMSEGSFPLVVMISIVAIIFCLATLVSKECCDD